MVEIFVRLSDASSAIQCSSVCKRWYNLILRNPKFIQKFIHQHHHRHLIDHSSPPRQLTLLFENSGVPNKNLCYYNSKLSQLVSKYNSSLYQTPSSGYINMLPYPLSMIGVSNDLLLLGRAISFNYYICNPITRTWLHLPFNPYPSVTTESGFMCQPNSSDSIDTSRYRFKVVLMSGTNVMRLSFLLRPDSGPCPRSRFLGKFFP